jgi:iron complex transport system ATP-binding protein
MSLLAIEALQIGYGARMVAQVGDLAMKRGTLVCLIGRNGQGKSTLLRTLAGLHPPVAGRVLLEHRPLDRLGARERARKIAVVLTERPEVPQLRADELVAMGRFPHTGWRAALSANDREVIDDSLALVGATHLADRYVDDLSDGERQRVMIARALAQQPDLLLLDEITAFLDLPSRVTIVDRLRTIARSRRIAVVLSSHDLELSLQQADAIWLLPGDGRFEHGAPEDIVLSGAIGRAFDQDNIAFDLRTGRFESPESSGLRIRVAVAGAARAWGGRMLRRAGYSQVTDDPVAEVTRDADGTWRVEGLGTAANFTALEALLRSLAHPKAAAEADEHSDQLQADRRDKQARQAGMSIDGP